MAIARDSRADDAIGKVHSLHKLAKIHSGCLVRGTEICDRRDHLYLIAIHCPFVVRNLVPIRRARNYRLVKMQVCKDQWLRTATQPPSYRVCEALYRACTIGPGLCPCYHIGLIGIDLPLDARSAARYTRIGRSR